DADRILSWRREGLMISSVVTDDVRKMHSEDSVDGLVRVGDLALSWDATWVTRWRLSDGTHSALSSRLTDDLGGACAVGPYTVAFWNAKGNIALVNAETGQRSRAAVHENAVLGLIPLPGNRALSWSFDGSLCLLEIEVRDGRPRVASVVPLRGIGIW